MRKLKKIESYSSTEDYVSKEYDINGRLIWRITSLQANSTIYYFYDYYEYDKTGIKKNMYCLMKQASDPDWLPFSISNFRYENNYNIINTYNSVLDNKIPDNRNAFFFPPLPPVNFTEKFSPFPLFNIINHQKIIKNEYGHVIHSYEKNIEDDAVYKVGGISRVHDIFEDKYVYYNNFGTVYSKTNIKDGEVSSKTRYEFGEDYFDYFKTVLTHSLEENNFDDYHEDVNEEFYNEEDDMRLDFCVDDYDYYSDNDYDNLTFENRKDYKNDLMQRQIFSDGKTYWYKYDSNNQLIKMESIFQSKTQFDLTINKKDEDSYGISETEILIKSFGGYPFHLSDFFDLPDESYEIDIYDYFSELKIKNLVVFIRKEHGQIINIRLINPLTSKCLIQKYFDIEFIYTDGKAQPRLINGIQIIEDEVKTIYKKSLEYHY